jgi:antitoxin CptB
MNNDITILKKRLIYRSQYRGTKEMDKLIGSFVESHIDKLNINELNELEIFLNVDDDTLYKFYNNQILETIIPESMISKLFKNYVYKK